MGSVKWNQVPRLQFLTIISQRKVSLDDLPRKTILLTILYFVGKPIRQGMLVVEHKNVDTLIKGFLIKKESYFSNGSRTDIKTSTLP